jgi:hypothetical protein
MMKTERTPGPWNWGADYSAATYCIWHRDHKKQITNIIARTEDTANAEYIVKACNSFDDLLAACEASLDALTDDENIALYGEMSIAHKLRCAIAKAKGETQCERG